MPPVKSGHAADVAPPPSMAADGHGVLSERSPNVSAHDGTPLTGEAETEKAAAAVALAAAKDAAKRALFAAFKHKSEATKKEEQLAEELRRVDPKDEAAYEAAADAHEAAMEETAAAESAYYAAIEAKRLVVRHAELASRHMATGFSVLEGAQGCVLVLPCLASDQLIGGSDWTFLLR